jgi:hypothetical protein
VRPAFAQAFVIAGCATLADFGESRYNSPHLQEKSVIRIFAMNRRYLYVVHACLLLVFVGVSALAQTNCEVGAGPLKKEPPGTVKPEEVIQRFTANEAKMETARRTYTFTEDVNVRTLRKGELGNDWEPDGEFRSVIDVSYDARGNRVDAVKFSPQSTLTRLSLGPEDFEDIHRFSVFALTTSELPRYNVTYAGQQKVDELETYVFDVAPKTIEKGKRYYQGRVWVESHDFRVVKSCGKSVPNTVITQKKRFVGKKVVGEGVQPTFATYREFIDGKYWFPTYSRSDDLLKFGNDEVKIRELIKFTNYRANSQANEVNKKTLTSEKKR